jgi:hypothetical protein
MDRQEFEATIEPMGPKEAWARIFVPFDVQTVFGTKSRVAVKGTLNGFPFRSTLFPEGDGRHYLYVNKGMREGAHAQTREIVRVELEMDSIPREVEVPEDLMIALAQNPVAEARFDKLAPSHKKEYVDWIESAKKPETRASRVEKAIPLILGGKRLNN